MTDDFVDSKYSGVYDVDCTADGKDLCEAVGVSGYPTIKYGDPSDLKALQDYSGGRSYDDLKKFADENLGPGCTPSTLDACSDEERNQLEGFLKESSEALLERVKKLKKEESDAQKKLSKQKRKLADKWETHNEQRTDHYAQQKNVKKGGEKAKKAWDANDIKLNEIRPKLQVDQDKLDKEVADLKESYKASGIKLMQVAAKANKDKKAEL